MAKVRGPLMSLQAHGSYAKKRIVFSAHGQNTIAKSWKPDKRTSSTDQLRYHAVLLAANKLWYDLPEYLKDQWRACSYDQPHVKDNSPIRAPIKGRLLFLRAALHFLNVGEQTFGSPYGPEPAPRKLSYGIVEFEIV